MDRIYECATNFQNLLGTKYRFVVSSKRKLKEIIVDFMDADFRHASGLHYVDDIAIERDPHKVLGAIIRKEITDEILDKSKKYKAVNNDGDSVQERVEAFKDLENFLDKSDFIRIYELQEFGSFIKADYFIEARYAGESAYIFLRKRFENDNYVVVTFFKKSRAFRGTSVYWMLKEKITGAAKTELYRHPNYKEEPEAK